jgi:hypothetical protein
MGEFKAALADARPRLPRPARHGEAELPGARSFDPVRQITESINILQASST